jgi:serine/threonine protein kinase
MTVCSCGAEIAGQGSEAVLCPACLLRMALEPNAFEADPSLSSEPARLLGPVGRGPHGTVHLAFRPDDDPRFVTVKLIDAAIGAPIDTEDFCERVRDLSHRLGSLPRGGLPEFLEPGVTADARVYVVAAYVPGPSIGDYLNSGRCSASERVQLAARLCTLVADLHRHGIVHGSIKSTNVIVTESRNGPFPVLLDVGVVPAINQSRPAGGDSTTGTSDGQRQDVRSLQALLIELLGHPASPTVTGADSAAALAAMVPTLGP